MDKLCRKIETYIILSLYKKFFKYPLSKHILANNQNSQKISFDLELCSVIAAVN